MHIRDRVAHTHHSGIPVRCLLQPHGQRRVERLVEAERGRDLGQRFAWLLPNWSAAAVKKYALANIGPQRWQIVGGELVKAHPVGSQGLIFEQRVVERERGIRIVFDLTPLRKQASGQCGHPQL
jgi:hypothetical protein